MKTKMNLRQIAVLVILLVAGTSAFAQPTWVTDAENDSITTTSQARYRIDLFYLDIHPELAAVFNASGINWTWPAGYAVADVKASDGATALTTGADGFYNEKSIVVTAKAAASGLILSAQEVSRPLVGAGCAGNTTTMTIDVVAKPTIPSWGADSGQCAPVPANLLVPANVTGYGKYDIRLNVAAFDLATNAAIGTPQNLDLANQLDVRTSETAKLHRFAIPALTLTNALLPGAPPATGYYYVITATDLQDRISKKNLNYNWGAHTGEVTNNDPDGGDNYRYNIYALPTTQAIQHIQNAY